MGVRTEKEGGCLLGDFHRAAEFVRQWPQATSEGAVSWRRLR
jgi:hypothetical protein